MKRCTALISCGVGVWLALGSTLSWGAFSDKVTTTPVIIQDAQGPAGDLLHYGGQEFCVPTAMAMSLAYLRLNGFNQIGGDAPAATDNLNFVKVLAGFMGTDPLGGTTYSPNMSDALDLYLAAKGISTADYTVSFTNGPSVATLATLNQPGTVVELCNGYYKNNGSRSGGHCVTLLGQGANIQGQSSPNTLIINNPYPSAYAPVPDMSGFSREFLNTVPTSGNVSSKGAIMLDASQFPGYLGSRVVIESALALTIDTSQLSSNNPTPATWALSAVQTFDLRDGNLSVIAPITGAGGITLNNGILSLHAADSTTGTHTVAAGSLLSAVTSGTPFGTGSIELQSGSLGLEPASGASALALVAASGAGNTLTYSGGASLSTDLNGHSSVSLTIGGQTDGARANLIRSGIGTLTIFPSGGAANLGGTERVIIAGSNGNLPAQTNGIVSPSIVVQDIDGSVSGDFATYGATGFARASYVKASDTALTSAATTDIFQANVNQTVSSGTARVYALKIDPGVTISGAGDLKLGPQAPGEMGLILNGGTISVAHFRMNSAEGLIYASKAGGTINSTVHGTGGLTKFGPGKLTLTGDNPYNGTTNINSGILEAANTSGSATGNSAVNVNASATLKISGASAVAGSDNGTTVMDRGTLLLAGGTLSGPLTMNAGSYLLGQGTISGSGTITTTIGSPTTNHDAPTYSGVEHLVFTGSPLSFTGDNFYSWRLNALDDNAANAGTLWSLVHFATTGTVDFGISGQPINLTIDFGVGVSDPNSGAGFWNQSHQWLIADDPTGWNNVYYHYETPRFAQGTFAFNLDGLFENLYATYTPSPIPEPGTLVLTFGGLAALLTRRASRRNRSR